MSCLSSVSIWKSFTPNVLLIITMPHLNTFQRTTPDMHCACWMALAFCCSSVIFGVGVPIVSTYWSMSSPRTNNGQRGGGSIAAISRGSWLLERFSQGHSSFSVSVRQWTALQTRISLCSYRNIFLYIGLVSEYTKYCLFCQSKLVLPARP